MITAFCCITSLPVTSAHVFDQQRLGLLSPGLLQPLVNTNKEENRAQAPGLFLCFRICRKTQKSLSKTHSTAEYFTISVFKRSLTLITPLEFCQTGTKLIKIVASIIFDNMTE